jgi:hypothetical protein
MRRVFILLSILVLGLIVAACGASTDTPTVADPASPTPAAPIDTATTAPIDTATTAPVETATSAPVEAEPTDTATTASTLIIRSAVTSKGYENGKAVDPTTTFSPTDLLLHAVVEVGNAPTDTKVKVVWTSVDSTDSGGTQYKDQKIDEKEVLTKETDSTVDFTLSNDQPWPVGKYKVDIYLDGNLERMIEFEVQPATIPSATAEPQATDTPVPQVSYGELVTAKGVGQSNAPVDPTTVFAPNDTIYAVLELIHFPSGHSAFARWYRDGTAIEDTSELTADRDYSNVYLEFHLFSTTGTGLQVGSYEVQFFIDGQPGPSTRFEVRQ